MAGSSTRDGGHELPVVRRRGRRQMAVGRVRDCQRRRFHAGNIDPSASAVETALGRIEGVFRLCHEQQTVTGAVDRDDQGHGNPRIGLSVVGERRTRDRGDDVARGFSGRGRSRDGAGLAQVAE